MNAPHFAMKHTLLLAALLASFCHAFAEDDDAFFAPSPYVQAISAFEKNDVAAAEKLIAPLVADPACTDADALALLGRVRLSQKRSPEAVASLARAVALKPDHASFLTFLGLALLDQANASEGPARTELATQSLARLTRAVELAPTNAEIQMALMRYHLTTPTGKNSEAAWRHADEANRLDPLSTGYDMAERAGELRLAEKYYRVDAANFPVSPWLPFCVARVQLARSATEEARATLTEVLQRFPGFGPAKQMLDGLPPPLAATK
jgi:predicted Zn-dependent protease